CIVPNTVAQMLAKKSNIRVHETNFNIPKRKIFYLHSIENRYENHIIAELINYLKQELIELEKNGVLECNF
ncbi:hypothetical protein, partial [Cetobacterium sp.]